MAGDPIWNWDEANATRMGAYLTNIESNYILNTLSRKHKPSILDIGVGSGRIAVQLLKHNYHNIIGMDIGNIQLKKCKVNTNSLVSVLLADAEQLPFANNSFDVILAMQLVDYLPNIENFLSDCYRILNPGGYFLFDYSNRSSPYRVIYKYRSQSDLFYHLNASRINQMARKIGFSIEKAYGFRWIPFPRDSNNVLIPLLARTENWIRPIIPLFLSPWLFSILRK
jgi:ubiquinone/menaquinone biosynthesis C-methylase UbiE